MIDDDQLRGIDAEQFRAQRPFPWLNLHDLLKPVAFRELHATFPTLERFEWHQGQARHYGQRPHNRYYLALEGRRATGDDGAGVIRRAELAAPWRALLDELETSREYRQLIQTLLAVPEWETRYAWHLGITGSEVSPHADAPVKVGTHILYFNTSDDWRAEWGGALLVLGGKTTNRLDPDFPDFATAVAMETIGNRSFLFKNGPDAWHGVQSLTCPPGRYRRLFNIIFEYPRRKKTVVDRIRLAVPWGRPRAGHLADAPGWPAGGAGRSA